MKTKKTPHRPKDTNQLAKYIMELSTGEIVEDNEPKKPNVDKFTKSKGKLK
jgi:hypothetical protein